VPVPKDKEVRSRGKAKSNLEFVDQDGHMDGVLDQRSDKPNK